jgi:hypothetical protein
LSRSANVAVSDHGLGCLTTLLPGQPVPRGKDDPGSRRGGLPRRDRTDAARSTRDHHHLFVKGKKTHSH